MMDVESHYAILLGINSPWEIVLVDLKLEQQKVEVAIDYNANE